MFKKWEYSVILMTNYEHYYTVYPRCQLVELYIVYFPFATVQLHQLPHPPLMKPHCFGR